jgi:hypothetical protein
LILAATVATKTATTSKMKKVLARAMVRAPCETSEDEDL